MKTTLDFIDFSCPSAEVAQSLIGVILLIDGVGGRIVEAEAYDRDDPASHSYSGPTRRNEVMFGSPPAMPTFTVLTGFTGVLTLSASPRRMGQGFLSGR